MRTIGNSDCNLISWKIIQLIQDRKLHSQYTFLHIPKTMMPQRANQEIDKMLQEIRLNQK